MTGAAVRVGTVAVVGDEVVHDQAGHRDAGGDRQHQPGVRRRVGQPSAVRHRVEAAVDHRGQRHPAAQAGTVPAGTVPASAAAADSDVPVVQAQSPAAFTGDAEAAVAAEEWPLAQVLAGRGIIPVSYAEWLRIETAETDLAQSLGRGERVKLHSSEAIWSACRPPEA